jgi:hypothetical protein
LTVTGNETSDRSTRSAPSPAFTTIRLTPLNGDPDTFFPFPVTETPPLLETAIVSIDEVPLIVSVPPDSDAVTFDELGGGVGALTAPLIAKSNGFSFPSFVPNDTRPPLFPAVPVSIRIVNDSADPGAIGPTSGSITVNPPGTLTAPTVSGAFPSLFTRNVFVGAVPDRCTDPNPIAAVEPSTTVCPFLIDTDTSG